MKRAANWKSDFRCECAVSWLLLLVSILPSIAAGTPIEFRRVFVPADSPSDWPREGEKLLPVETKDFEAWVAAANRPPAEAHLEEAEYHARLAGDRLVATTGIWRVRLDGDRPARLPLEMETLQLRHVEWTGDARQRARIGWWAGEDDQSLTHALEVPHSGTLEFAWQLHSPSATSQEIPLRFPAAARTRLVLDLPESKRPEIRHGLVLAPPTELPNGAKRWLLALAQASPTGLRIVDATGKAAAAKLPDVRFSEQKSYHLSNRGVDLEVRLRLDVEASPPSQLRVSLPAGMRLVDAVANKQSLPWSVSTVDDADGASRATIELPTFPDEVARTVLLRAWSALPSTDLAPLPALVVDDSYWTSGSIRLSLDASLELCDLATVDSVQVDDRRLSDDKPNRGRRFSFQSYSPQAAVKLTVRPRRASGHVTLVTGLQFANSGVDGRVAARIVVDEGQLHSLTATLRPGWSIEGVESVPADAIDEWYVEGDRNARRVEFRLNQAVAPERPLLLVVSGRSREDSSVAPRTLGDSAWLDWQGLTVKRSLLQVSAAEPFELETVGEPEPVLPSTLPADEQQLLSAPDEAQVFDLTSPLGNAGVRLVPRRAAYDADIELDAALSSSTLIESYQVTCRPRGSGIDHVLVYVSESSPDPFEWIDEQTGESLVSERMPTDDPRWGGLPPGGELWLLHLRRMYARPVAIRATLTLPWTENRRVPLIAFPDAANQRGRVVITSAGVELPSIVAEQMRPTSLPAPRREGHSPGPERIVNAIYRFQPVRFYDAGPAPALWLGPAKLTSYERNLIATEVAAESRYTTDGRGSHCIKYQLENRGIRELALKMSPGTLLRSALVDGAAIDGVARLGPADEVVIPLPARRFVSLELQLASQERPLGLSQRLPAPFPAGPMTMLQGSWTLWLPPEYSAGGAPESSLGGESDWRVRLFGPLARRRGDSPFNPMQSSDWSGLWSTLNLSVAKQALAAQTPSSPRPLPKGWNRYQLDFVAAPPATATIVRQASTSAWLMAICLAVFASVSLAGLRTIHVVGLTLAAATVSLLLPAAYAPLATGAVLGLLLSPLWRWSRPALETTEKCIPACLFVVLFALSPARAATPAAEIERVLIPVDVDGKAAGTKCFVRDEFLRKLLDASDERQFGPRWLLLDMRCEGDLITQPDSTALDAGGWTWIGELEVLSRDTTVELPLVQADARWPATASLDGFPVPLEWDASGRRCSVHAAEPGPHRLSIAFRPRRIEDGNRRKIVLSLPPLAGTAVLLKTPVVPGELSVDGARPIVTGEPAAGNWRGILTGSGPLIVSWPTANSAGEVNNNRSVEELQWLKLSAGGSVLEAKLRLTGSAWPARLDVRIERGFELDADESDVTSHTVEALPSGQRLIHLGLSRTRSSQHGVRLRFNSRDTSPLGRCRLPMLEVVSLPVAKRLVAVSWDSTLECELASALPQMAEATADFEASWADDEPTIAPQLLFDGANLAPSASLWVRPRPADSTCRESLELTAGNRRLRVAYQAQISPIGRGCFQWSLAVPSELHVEHVSADAGGKAVSVDWVRAAPDRINLFFAQAMKDPFQLQLVGTMLLAESSEFPIPRIVSDTPTPAAQVVALYRTDDVLAQWSFRGDPPEEIAADAVEQPAEPARQFVAAHLVESSTADTARIRIEPNRPVVGGAVLTSLANEQGNWTATFSCNLRVLKGEVRVLPLRISPAWVGPYEIVSPAPATAVSATVDGGTVLSIRLPQPVQRGETIALVVRSPLSLAGRASPAAPSIVPLLAGSVQQYLELPTSDGDAAIAWRCTGIESAPLAEELRSLPDPEATQTYRIVAEKYTATLRARPEGAAAASVRLAETSVVVGPMGGQVATSRFVVLPQGADECVVELAIGEGLVSIGLDGHPALARPLDERRWQVQLGPPNLPQTLEIVSRSRLPVDPRADAVELQRPVLTCAGQPMVVELGLWSFARPNLTGIPRVPGAAVITPAEATRLWLDRLLSISQMATRSVIESPVVDGYNWYNHWTQQLASQVRAAQSLELKDQAASAQARVAPPRREMLADVADRVSAWMQEMEEAYADAEAIAGRGDSPRLALADRSVVAPASPGAKICLVSDDDQDRLTIRLEGAELTPAETRWTAIASLVAAGAVLFWIRRQKTALAFLEAWPELLAIGIGLIAWAWLRPSVVGFLIVLVSAGRVIGRVHVAHKKNHQGTTTLD